MKNFELIFESENIQYVKLSEDLINEYLTMVNNPEVANKISHNMRTFTYEEEEKWVRTKLEENAICYSMIEKATGEYIGNVEIMEINNGIGEIGITITPKQQNKHYGTEAMKAIMKYGYNKLNLDGFELNVYSTNPRAIHCYENVGFQKDGVGKTEEDIHMIHKK